MLPKTFFIKVDSKNSSSLSNLSMLENMFNASVCYFIRKYLENMHYKEIDVTYNYDIYKINNAYFDAELTAGIDTVKNLNSCSHVLRVNIEDIIEYYRFNYDVRNTVLNFSSCLINIDTFLVTAFVLEKS